MSGFGALMKLMKAIKGGYIPTEEIKEVGTTFSRADPQTYFRTTPNPARSMTEAEEQYGVGMKWVDDNMMEAWLKSDPEFKVEIDTMRKLPKVPWFEQMPALDRPVYTIDSTGLVPSSGAGSRIYPALFDALSDDFYNVSAGLTGINKMRRSLNMADAMIRNPRLGDRVLPSHDQFDALVENKETSSRLVPWYMGASDIERLGALELNAALQGGERLQRGIRSGIGPSTIRKFQAVEDSLLGNPPKELLGLGLKRGGLAQIQHAQ